MNKRKLIILISTVVVLILICVLVSTQGGDNGAPNNPLESTPVGSATTEPSSNKETIEGIVALSKEDMDSVITQTIHNESINGEELTLSQQYANAVTSGISYEILEMKEAGKAVVKFTYIDAIKMADAYGTVSDPDDFYAFCIQQIGNNVAPLIEATIEVEYRIAADGSVEIVDSIALADVLTGGAVSEFLKLMEGR